MSQNNSASQLVLKGTTTIGVVCKDGVILASDTRVTMGFYVAHKAGKKVYKIDDHIGMTIAGTVADADAGVRRETHRSRSSDCRVKTRAVRPESGPADAGAAGATLQVESGS